MKPFKITLLVLLVILLLLGAYFAFLFMGSDAEPSPPDVTFPIATSTGPGGEVQEPMTVPLQDGRELIVRNFIENGTTIEDPANDGTYYLAGGSGYCYEDGTCPSAGGELDFNVAYFSQDRAFVVGLNEEPLGDTRRAAEQYLMEALGVGEPEMCALNYYIGTTVYVNQIFGSMGNLGFSFCPGAVELP